MHIGGTCVVCLGRLGDSAAITAAICGHVYHIVCIRQAREARARPECPQCRVPLPTAKSVLPALYFADSDVLDASMSSTDGDLLQSEARCKALLAERAALQTRITTAEKTEHELTAKNAKTKGDLTTAREQVRALKTRQAQTADLLTVAREQIVAKETDARAAELEVGRLKRQMGLIDSFRADTPAVFQANVMAVNVVAEEAIMMKHLQREYQKKQAEHEAQRRKMRAQTTEMAGKTKEIARLERLVAQFTTGRGTDENVVPASKVPIVVVDAASPVVPRAAVQAASRSPSPSSFPTVHMPGGFSTASQRNDDVRPRVLSTAARKRDVGDRLTTSYGERARAAAAAKRSKSPVDAAGMTPMMQNPFVRRPRIVSSTSRPPAPKLNKTIVLD